MKKVSGPNKGFALGGMTNIGGTFLILFIFDTGKCEVDRFCYEIRVNAEPKTVSSNVYRR